MRVRSLVFKFAVAALMWSGVAASEPFTVYNWSNLYSSSPWDTGSLPGSDGVSVKFRYEGYCDDAGWDPDESLWGDGLQDANYVDPVSGSQIYWDSSDRFVRVSCGSLGVFRLTFSEPVPVGHVVFAVRGFEKGQLNFTVDAGDATPADFHLVNDPLGYAQPGYNYSDDGILTLTAGEGVEHGDGVLVGDPSELGRVVQSVSFSIESEPYRHRFAIGVAYADEFAGTEPVMTVTNPSPDAGDAFGFNLVADESRILALARRDDTAGLNKGLLHLLDTESGEPLQTFEPLNPAGGEIPIGSPRFFDLADDYVVWMMGNDSVNVYSTSTGEFVSELQAPPGGVFGKFSGAGKFYRNHRIMDAAGERVAIAGMAGLPDSGASCGEETTEAVYLLDIQTSEVLGRFSDLAPGRCNVNQRYVDGNEFGDTVQLAGDKLVVSAPRASDGGAIYIFDSDSGALLEVIEPPQKVFGATSALEHREFGRFMRVSDGRVYTEGELAEKELVCEWLTPDFFDCYIKVSWILKSYVFDLETGRLIAAHEGGAMTRAFSSIDGNLKVYGGVFGPRLIHALSGEWLGEVPPPTPWAWSERFYYGTHLDGFRLTAGHNDYFTPDRETGGRLFVFELDADDDAIADLWETLYSLDPENPFDATGDGDGDGLDNHGEYENGTNPVESDTDGDGLSDGDEVHIYGTNPRLADSDLDGIDDIDELQITNTNPMATDSDGDTMTDGWELEYGLNPLFRDGGRDLDGDGLTNRREFNLGTRPDAADTDGDTMDDRWEMLYGLDYLRRDGGLNPDGDTYTNRQEYNNGTNPWQFTP